LKEWVTLKEDGSCDGELGLFFEQGMRLEKTRRNIGKHASGLIICQESLTDICPLIPDKDGSLMCGWEMEDAETAGIVKFDLLGLYTLDKIEMCQNFIRTGIVKWQRE
jgi:DNA polymerase III alpha subunit